MSIEQTIAGLKRANAIVRAHKLTEAAKIAPARRGNFCLIEREHRYTSLLHGAYTGYRGWTPAIVTSVTRDGIVKEVRLADGRALKRRDWAYCHVDSKGLIKDPAGVCEALREPADKAPARWAIEYQDRGEANAAIKAAARIEQ
jgi:hypothetical protein